MKNKLMPTIVLGTICLVSALILSVVNMFTAPVIAEALAAKEQAAYEEILAGCGTVTDITEANKNNLQGSIVNAYKAENGYIFKASATGKSSGIIIMIGVDEGGKITGTKCTSNNETPAYSKPVFGRTEGDEGVYIGMDEASFTPDIIAGSTKTSRAYADAVKAALDTYTKIVGGQ